MPKKRKGEMMRDNAAPCCKPLVTETMETLPGPGPCRTCAGPKFDHTPFGGIAHQFVPRDPLFRAVQAAKHSERKR